MLKLKEFIAVKTIINLKNYKNYKHYFTVICRYKDSSQRILSLKRISYFNQYEVIQFPQKVTAKVSTTKLLFHAAQ